MKSKQANKHTSTILDLILRSFGHLSGYLDLTPFLHLPPFLTGLQWLILTRTRLNYWTITLHIDLIQSVYHLPFYLPNTTYQQSIKSLDFTHQEVQNLLLRIKQHSATGPDGISAWMLKHSMLRSHPLLLPFSTPQLGQVNSLPNGFLPIFGRRDMGWKDCTISGVESLGIDTIICKILEKHLHQLLGDHRITNNILSENQYEFHSGRSTVIPLLLATHYWQTILEKHSQVGWVFFDLRKAFDHFWFT